METKRRIKRTEVRGYAQVYAAYFFNREKPITKWPIPKGIILRVHLHGDTVERLQDITKRDEQLIINEIKDKFNITGYYESLDTDIICLEYPLYGPNKKPNKAMVASTAQMLYEHAIHILKGSTGDDDFFDYGPGAAEAIGELLEKLGHENLSKALYQYQEQNGHFD